MAPPARRDIDLWIVALLALSTAGAMVAATVSSASPRLAQFALSIAYALAGLVLLALLGVGWIALRDGGWRPARNAVTLGAPQGLAAWDLLAALLTGVGTLALLPLLAFWSVSISDLPWPWWFGAFVIGALATGLSSSLGGLVVASYTDRLWKRAGAQAPLRAGRSLGCVLTFLVASISIVLLLGV